MPLVLPEAPDEALALVRANAPLLLRAMGFDISATHPFAVARAYPLYTFAREAVVDDHPLQTAWFAAWEYLIVDGDSTIGLAEVAATDPDRNPSLRFATLHPASYAERITARIVDAQNLPEVATPEPFELRILRVPSLTALAIWLRHGNGNIVLPIETIRDGVPVDETTWKGNTIITSEANLASLLRPIAYYRLNSHDDG
jgi:hypothetical protein